MTEPTHHLAQLNVARLRHPLDDPRTADFVAALDPINELAEASPGFVWRLTGEDGESSSYVRLPEVEADDVTADPLFIVNLSVWETAAHLRDFVFRTDHRRFLKRRSEWFERYDGPYSVCWWVPVGHEPELAEAIERLEVLRRDGPGPTAFHLHRHLQREAGPSDVGDGPVTGAGDAR